MKDSKAVAKAIGKYVTYSTYGVIMKEMVVNECDGFALYAAPNLLNSLMRDTKLPPHYSFLYVAGVTSPVAYDYIYVVYGETPEELVKVTKARVAFKMKELVNVKDIELRITKELLQISKEALIARH